MTEATIEHIPAIGIDEIKQAEQLECSLSVLRYIKALEARIDKLSETVKELYDMHRWLRSIEHIPAIGIDEIKEAEQLECSLSVLRYIKALEARIDKLSETVKELYDMHQSEHGLTN